MYKTALKELGEAKKNNRSKLTFLIEEDIKERMEGISLLEEIEVSMANGFDGFYVVYQPQIKHGTFDVCGVEALMRYKSSKTGKEYSPTQFVPLMEQAGLMKEASLWILKESLSQVKKWREHLPNLNVNVNFSLVDLKHTMEDVIKLFKQSGLPEKTLTVEITETVGADEVGSVSMLTRTLNAAGISISIDDFGTGYSSLNMLATLPIDVLKLDMFFVQTAFAEEADNGTHMLGAVVDIARHLAVPLIAEGVETQEQLDELKAMGCDMAQGFYFARPMPVRDYEKIVYGIEE
jgi:EAL domain-containing protein (putative c-di-GMP-specific phosphodiesterase class I)